MTSNCCYSCCCLCTAAIIFGLVQVNCILARSTTRAAPPKTRMWMRSNVACNETNLMLHTCHQWTLLLQLPVGGGWRRSVCVLRSKIACPKLGKLNVVLRLAAAKRRAKSTKAAYRVVWARGTLSGDWVRFAVFGFGIALRARHNRFGKRMRNAGDIIGKHKLYEELHELFSCFPIFPFSYAGWLPNDLARMLAGAGVAWGAVIKYAHTTHNLWLAPRNRFESTR